ncbi:UvrD-helicase domain-containing protein [Polluticaenibacter yanchengensis]|uniref:DNA 3'-5' helicase n=1 Tax=Polluticaenibacter yanchengensis TaxID=3014562 RepID=A0ABT4ULR1_9BACT|nr:UvrD-helicase domain-containing protein [Chitinophagaceae bacterium LY-5]
MLIQLTREQEEILATNRDIVINAVAGSGKTTTLIEYAKSRPANSKILYIAFNSSVRKEAVEKFEKHSLLNVRVETAHSLAFKFIVAGSNWQVNSTGYKSYEWVKILDIKSGDSYVDLMLATHVNNFIAFWCNSAETKVQELNYLATIENAKTRQFVNHFYEAIVNYTRQALAMMNNGTIAITHDFYLKKFQLAMPILPYDYILFDEGQDASAAMLDVFLNQKAIKIIVGDEHQQIYSWRYAINSLQKVDFDKFYLSQSFRFSDEIAFTANHYLKWKPKFLKLENPVRVLGTDADAGNITSRAVIGRTNLALLADAIKRMNNRQLKSCYFEGNINSYLFAEEGGSIYDILNLSRGNTDGIKSPLIASMPDMKALDEYIENTEDRNLSMLVDMVKQFGQSLPNYVSQLQNMHVDDKNKADIIYSTVHRCKGLEYDEVTLLDDFINEQKFSKLLSEINSGDKSLITVIEEVNLVYVAATRARIKLNLPQALSPFRNVFIQVNDNSNNERIIIDTPTGVRRLRKLNASPNASHSTIESRAQYKFRNNGAAWHKDDDKTLEDLFKQGQSLKELGEYFGRTNSAISSRLKKLRLIEGYDEYNDF